MKSRSIASVRGGRDGREGKKTSAWGWYLELSSGLQVSEHLDDVLGHGWGRGQMVTGGLESVLIGHPGDGVGDGAFGVGEFTLGHGSGFFGLVSDLLLDSALAD